MSGLLRICVSDRPFAGAAAVAGWHVTLAGPADEAALSPEEIARCAAMTRPADAALRRAAYALRRAALGARVGVAPRDVVLPAGWRMPGPGGAYASLSHTRGAVAIAIADRPVGVDVEACDRADDPARLAARYFAADERDGDAADVAWRWTAKEALMKAAGMTLRAALATSMGPRAAAPFVREIAGATLTVLAPIEGYACAVATAPR